MLSASNASLKIIQIGLPRVAACLLLVLLAVIGLARDVRAADTNISVQVCHPVAVAPPTISSPADGTSTEESSVVVSGTAPSNETVYAFRDNTQVGFVTADTNGDYSISVNLSVGDNVLHASTKNNCDEYFASSPVTVTRAIPPEPPSPPAPSEPEPETSKETDTPPSTSGPTPQTIPDPSPAVPVAPEILEPRDGIRLTDPTLLVVGRADPLTRVRINLNGSVVAEVITDEEGDFVVSITLKEGENKLFVSVGDGGLRSPTVTIYYGPLAPVAFLARSSSGWARLARWMGLVFLVSFLLWLSWWWLLAVRRRRRRGEAVTPPEKRS